MSAPFTTSKAIDDALAAIAATKDDPKPPSFMNELFHEGCLTQGAVRRCSGARQGAATPRLAALEALGALLDRVLSAAPRVADFTLVLKNGESSKDSSSSTVTWTLSGSTLTRATEASGRQKSRSPPTSASKPFTPNAAVADAFGAVLASPEDRGPEPTLQNTHYHRGCLTSAGRQSCAVAKGQETTPRLQALEALGAALQTHFGTP